MNTLDTLPIERIQRHLETRFNPLRGLTPRRLADYLDAFRRGHLRQLALLMEVLEERDDTLASVVGKLKQAVARQGWEILVQAHPPEHRALAEEQRAALEEFYNNLEATHALDQDELGGLSMLVRQMMDAIGKRWAAHYLEWRPRAGRLELKAWFTPLYFFESTRGRLRYLAEEYALEGQDLAPREWMVTTGPGLMIPSSVAWMYKHLPLQDWLRFCDKFGLPGVIAKTDASPGTPEWESNVEAIRSLANDWAAVFGRGSEVSLLEARGSGNLPFADLVERMDRAMVVLWRGADLATLGSNQRVGVSLQREEAEILESGYAERLSESINAQITKWVLEYYFGANAPRLAYLRLRSTQRQDTRTELQIDQFLINQGAKLSVRDALERYGRRPATEDEEVLAAR
jgi:phage gp29-like protein